MVETTRKGKETDKLHVTLEGDNGTLYCFETGWGSETSKSIVSAIALLTPSQLARPITLRPYEGKNESVVFVDLYCGGEKVFAPYNSQTDWGKALEAALSVLGKPSEPTPKPSTDAPPDNIADIIAQTDIEMERVGWTKVEGRDYLKLTYGKAARSLLTDDELIDFLNYLRSLPSSQPLAATR